MVFNPGLWERQLCVLLQLENAGFRCKLLLLLMNSSLTDQVSISRVAEYGHVENGAVCRRALEGHQVEKHHHDVLVPAALADARVRLGAPDLAYFCGDSPIIDQITPVSFAQPPALNVYRGSLLSCRVAHDRQKAQF